MAGIVMRCFGQLEHFNDPPARKLEAILASLGCQMHLEESRSMSPTRLTDYFT